MREEPLDPRFESEEDRQRWKDLLGGEYLDWALLTPEERMKQSFEILWPTFIGLGRDIGIWQPERDSPFYGLEELDDYLPVKNLHSIKGSAV